MHCIDRLDALKYTRIVFPSAHEQAAFEYPNILLEKWEN